MQILTTQVEQGDVVRRKQIWKYDVPTAHEVKLLLDYLPDYSEEKVALGLMIVAGPRPKELCNLSWNRCIFNEEKNELLRMYHDVYKAKSYKGRRGKRTEYKEVEKLIQHQYVTLADGRQQKIKHSPWMSDQLLKYRQRDIGCQGNALFGWTEGSSLRKVWTRFRAELRLKLARHEVAPEYAAFMDTDVQFLFGNDGSEYRINLYSLRKFSITFHHWVIFKGNAVKTAHYFGHSDPETTLKHYIRPPEAIGLTQGMIDANISIDEFIHLQGKAQMRLVEFDPTWKAVFLKPGQRSLVEFA